MPFQPPGVLVVVLEKKRLAFLPRAIAHRLEGSRFIRWQLYRLRAGGSRELPSAMFAHRVCSVRQGYDVR